MTDVNQTIAKFQSNFNPSAAAGMDSVFQFNVTDADSYFLTIKDQNCSIDKGVNDDANITLIMDSATLSGLSDGSLDGMQAFMSGKLRVEGDMMLAMKLHELFPS
jgi:putative sterol carrier protein